MKKIARYSDICVLFRSHRDKKEILDIFEKEGIPYYLKGIDDLIYQDEAKAVLRYSGIYSLSIQH